MLVPDELSPGGVRPGSDAGADPGDPRGGPGHVKVIYFNDPVLIGEGLTKRLAGHDDHLHVRYCEAWHPVIAYRCASAGG